MKNSKQEICQYLANGDILIIKGHKMKRIAGTNAWDNPAMKKSNLITQSQIDILKDLYKKNGDRLNDKAILNYNRINAMELIEELRANGLPQTKVKKIVYEKYKI